MRKNGSRLISVKQYKSTDLFVFALILAAAEILRHFAGKWFPGGALFTFSLTVPIVLTVMMRWGWTSVLYAAASGLLVSLLGLGSATGVTGTQFAVYIIGNAFIGLMLIPTYLIGKDKIRAKWWSSALYAIGGWLCVYLGRSIIWAIAYAIAPVSGLYAWTGFVTYATTDFLSLAMAVVVILVLRRLDGLFEDQKSYLSRFDKARRDKMHYDEYGDQPIDIDEEALSILNRDNDLYD